MGNCFGKDESKEKKGDGKKGGAAGGGKAGSAASKKVPMSYQYILGSLPKGKALYEQSRDPADYEVAGMHGAGSSSETTGSAATLASVVAGAKEGTSWARLPGQVNDQRINIEKCSNMSFLILDHCDSIQIDECVNCLFYLGPTTGSAFIRNCKHCNFVLACGQLRTRDLKHCSFSMFCSSRPVIESSSNIKIGPYNHTGYFELREHFAKSKLSTFNNRWDNVHDFTPGRGGGPNFTLISAEEAHALVPPLSYFKSTAGKHVSAEEEEMFVEQPVVPLTTGAPGFKARRYTFIVVFTVGSISEAIAFTEGLADACREGGGADNLLLLGTVEHVVSADNFPTLEAPGRITAAEKKQMMAKAGPTIAVGFGSDSPDPAFWNQFNVKIQTEEATRKAVALTRDGGSSGMEDFTLALFALLPLTGMGFGSSH